MCCAICESYIHVLATLLVRALHPVSPSLLKRARGKPAADRTQGPRAKGRELGRRTTGVTGAASWALVSCTLRVHRISTHVRDDREAPLDRVRRAKHTLSCTSDKAKYPCCGGLRCRANQGLGLTRFRCVKRLAARRADLSHPGKRQAEVGDERAGAENDDDECLLRTCL